MSRFAAIDIGTNTILMLVADVAADGAFTVVSDRSEIARLGQGVDQTRSLSSAGMERALAVLRDYMRACRQSGIKEIAAVGTSALRDAVNAKTFTERLKRELNLDLRVLSGAEEAAYSYLSVRKGLKIDAPEMLVVDIGGGSTEFIWARDGKLQGWASIDVGSGRLTQRHVRSGEIERQAALYQSKPVAERKQIAGLEPMRADVILAGALLTERILNLFAVDEAIVSDQGIRYRSEERRVGKECR